MSENAQARTGWNPLRGLYAWIMRNAHGRHAWAILAGVAFAESSFFPIPPDVMLVPMGLAHRERALAMAAWTAMWSVIGGCLGYAIGALLYNSVGQWLVNVYGMGGELDAFRAAYAKYGALIVLQGITPIPYKVVTISAGFAGLNFPLFLLLSAITRSVRFAIVGVALYLFGEPVKTFMDKWLEWAFLALLVLVVAGFVVLHYLVK